MLSKTLNWRDHTIHILNSLHSHIPVTLTSAGSSHNIQQRNILFLTFSIPSPLPLLQLPCIFPRPRSPIHHLVNAATQKERELADFVPLQGCRLNSVEAVEIRPRQTVKPICIEISTSFKVPRGGPRYPEVIRC